MRTLAIIFVLASIAACNFDKLPEPTVADVCENLQPVYEGEIEAIIERTCSYSGCHEGGSAFGDYSTYQSMFNALDGGKVSTRIFNIGDMPPDYAPDGKPKELAEEELQLIECWIANGFPEN